jgi:hypothetical protein
MAVQSTTASWPNAMRSSPHRSVDVDPELVGQTQHLALADVDLHDRVAGVVTQDALEPLDLEFVERGRGQPQPQRVVPAPSDSPDSTVTVWAIRPNRDSSRRSRRPD